MSGSDYGCCVSRCRVYPFGTRTGAEVLPDASRRPLSARRSDDSESLLLDRGIPLACPAWTPDLATAWMAVAGLGVPPPEATLGARVRLACRRCPANRLAGRGHRMVVGQDTWRVLSVSVPVLRPSGAAGPSRLPCPLAECVSNFPKALVVLPL